MEFFKSRKTAAAFFILAAILFIIVGINCSLWALSSDIEDLFYEGIYNSEEEYTAPSISPRLEKRINAAMGLIPITF